ncbi:MAG: gliding motility-associated C-terminal domain-containing protein [Cyclobacteriaceae bacterium]
MSVRFRVMVSCFVLCTVQAMTQVPFIENRGQWPSQQQYRAHFPGAEVILLKNGMDYILHQGMRTKGTTAHREIAPHGNSQIRATGVGMRLDNACPSGVAGEHVLPTTYNYMIGSDPSRWGIASRAFARVHLQEPWPHISMVAYGNGSVLEYDWSVGEGGDPSVIRWHYEGAGASIDEDGNIRISTGLGEIVEGRPIAYQFIRGRRVNVNVGFYQWDHQFGFVFPDGYDSCEELIVDPMLIFSAYSGSTFDNWGNSATYDNRGNTYSAGITTPDLGGFSYPVTNGSVQTLYQGGDWDIGIMKFDSAGSQLLYATYLGGNGTEVPQSLVVNTTGDLVVLGTTGSDNFPVTSGRKFEGGEDVEPIQGIRYLGGTDLFVARLSADGTRLVAGTYLGGSRNDGINFIEGSMFTSFHTESPLARNYGDQERGDVITDVQDNVFIASVTASTDFPVVNTSTDADFGGGHLDGVVAKLSADLNSIQWTRLVGGTGEDAALSVKMAPDGDVYLAGGTNSTDFRGLHGFHQQNNGDIDGWIARLSGDGTTVSHGTYLGTGGYDQVYFIDLDTAQRVYAYGQTNGPYPVQGQVYKNASGGQFLHQLSSDLSQTGFSTTLGSGRGGPDISPTAFLVSDCGTIYMGGWGGYLNDPFFGNYVGGNTLGMPVTPNAYQSRTNGNNFYFMVLSGDASQFLYGTFLGGFESPTHVDGGTSRFDKRGIVYHAVCAGCGGHSDFPAVNVPSAFQQNNSPNCNNAVFKFDLSLLRAAVVSNTPDGKHPGATHFCPDQAVLFQNRSIGGKIFEWLLGDGTRIIRTDTASVLHQYAEDGDYVVSLKAFDAATCKAVDSASVTVHIKSFVASAGPDQAICGSEATIGASGGVRYEWYDEAAHLVSTNPVFQISLPDSASFFVHIFNDSGCEVVDTMNIQVVKDYAVEFDASLMFQCEGRPKLRVVNRSSPEASVVFQTGDGFQTDADEWIHEYASDGTFQLQATGKLSYCVKEAVEVLNVSTLVIPNVITPAIEDGANDTFKIMYGLQSAHQAGYSMKLSIDNRWGERVFQSADYQNEWSASQLPAGTYYYRLSLSQEVTCKGWVSVVR